MRTAGLPPCPPKIQDALEALGADECTLCGGPPSVVGMWQPSPAVQRLLGVPQGRVRFKVYCLCSVHAANLERSLRKIERRAIEHAQAMRN